MYPIDFWSLVIYWFKYIFDIENEVQRQNKRCWCWVDLSEKRDEQKKKKKKKKKKNMANRKRKPEELLTAVSPSLHFFFSSNYSQLSFFFTNFNNTQFFINYLLFQLLFNCFQRVIFYIFDLLMMFEFSFVFLVFVTFFFFYWWVQNNPIVLLYIQYWFFILL